MEVVDATLSVDLLLVSGTAGGGRRLVNEKGSLPPELNLLLLLLL